MFREIRIGRNTVKNRIVRSATNDHMGYEDGTISDAQVQLYETLAKNDVGLIITGHISVSDRYRADAHQPLISDDRFIAGLKRIPEAVHKYGGIVYAQISQAGRKAYLGSADINEMTEQEIETVISEFIDGAVRIKKAGFDGVQVHLAHGYFLSNVLDDSVNHRTDAYGGSAENRFKILHTIIKGIKTKCGEDYSVIVKLCANNEIQGDYDETLLYYAKELDALGVDAIELSGIDFMKKNRDEKSYYLREALLLKQNVDCPVILVGGLYDKETMQSVLNQGIDMISMARPFICEPDFVTKLKNGSTAAKCVRCFRCFKTFQTVYKNCVFLPENEWLKKLYS